MKIGVALSGSGFLGVLHVGALCALEDLGYEIGELAGTSGGSIVAALYASGLKGPYLKELFQTTDFTKFLDYQVFSAFLYRRNGLCDGNYLRNWIDFNCKQKCFGDLSIPLTIMATDLTSGTSFTFNREKTPGTFLSTAARASSAIPLIYTSVPYKGHELQDGGMVCNIPTDHLDPANQRIGLEVVSAHKFLPPGAGWIDRGIQAVSLMLAANEKARVAWARQVGVEVIPLPSLGFSGLDRSLTAVHKEDLYQTGYRAVQRQFSTTKGEISGTTP